MRTTKIGMVGKKPKVVIKNSPPAADKQLTPEEKAQARAERRRIATEKANAGNR